MSAAGRALWELNFRFGPILLTRGIAQNLPGGILPILALTDAASLAQTLLTGSFDPDSFFANWQVMPGGTLINQQIATYPFANQAVAANATIQQPNSVSMLMTCPAKAGGGLIGAVAGAAAGGLLTGSVAGAATGAVLGAVGGFTSKLATITALQKTIAQHNSLGGTYSVLTAAYIYTDCILPMIRDVTTGETQQPQVRWQWDFVQPQVLSLAAAQNALNNLAQRLSSGLPLAGGTNLGTTSYGLGAGFASSALKTLFPQ